MNVRKVGSVIQHAKAGRAKEKRQNLSNYFLPFASFAYFAPLREGLGKNFPLELEAYGDYLEFHPEYQLTAEPGPAHTIIN